MAGGGMVAVVRALKDAGLAVTLLDSGREYSLLPDPDPAVTHPVAQSHPVVHSHAVAHTPPVAHPHPVAHTPCSRHAACQYAADGGLSAGRRESAVQATDGRYASTYKTVHCNLAPTSPPDFVTEFPPQKTELCPGHENFVIGGTGSGDTSSPPVRCGSFRGGLCWPDRGSVFAAKPSAPMDSFSSSLRRYPQVQQRGSELLERLVSYTQARHSTLKSQQSSASPTRAAETKNPRQQELVTKRLEESPTRDRIRRGTVDQDTLESWKRSPFSRTNEVRCLTDVSRKIRDGFQSLSHQPNVQPEKLNKPHERCEPNVVDKKIGVQFNTNLVNMEIQAAIPMVSREVVTMPIAAPSQRTIAISFTPTLSLIEPKAKNTSNRPSDILTTTTEIHQPLGSAAKPHEEINTMELRNHKIKLYKGSKSQEEIKMMADKASIMQDARLVSNSKLNCRMLNKTNRRKKFMIKLAENIETMSKSDNINEYRRLNDNDFKSFKSLARIISNDVGPNKKPGDEDLCDILGEWLDLIPLKLEKPFGKFFDKEIIFNDFLECLSIFTNNAFDSNKKDKLKSDILSRLDSLPVDIKENKTIILSKFADLLINKVGCKKYNMRTNTCKREIKQCQGICSKYVAPHEVELKIFISAELSLYLEKTCIKINRRKISDLENDLVDCFNFFMCEMHFGNYKRVKKNVIKILRDYGFSEYQATHFTNLLIPHLKESFLSDTAPTNVRSETFVVLSNKQSVELLQKLTYHAEVNGKGINNSQCISNVDDYNMKICREIDEWLSSLSLPVLENTENRFRTRIINDLAKDIIDRKKYLELNPFIKIESDKAELELLRYQIFKWIGKLVGEDNCVSKDHALQLLRRIQTLTTAGEITKMNNISATNTYKRPLPCGYTRSDISVAINKSLSKIKNGTAIDAQSKKENTALNATIFNRSRQFKVMTISQEGTDFKVFNNKVRCNQNSEAICCTDIKKSRHRLKTVEQLEAEYEKFVKIWVQEVPMPASTLDQEALVKRARVELQNTLWKIVSKLNCDPATYYNRFFYEDLLDDAIDDLLDALPQTPEMISARDFLKAEFIEKTLSLNDHIKACEEASFKNKLIKNVVTNLRTHGLIDNEYDETIRQHEDLQIKRIAEAYILYITFRNNNKLTGAFKKKLAEEIKGFVDNLKKNHVKELGNVDAFVYKTEIMNALEKVPLPCERLLSEEADSILLGIEIEQWYIDLPTISNEDTLNSYQTKQKLEILANKIKRIESSMDANDSYTTLRDEVSRFLEKEPLDHGESANINFMADELVNRVKNMKKQDTNQNAKRVVFQALDSYDDFSKNVPFASSYIETYPENLSSNINLDNNKNQTLKCDKSCETCLIPKDQIDLNNHLETSDNRNMQQQPTFLKEPFSYNESPNQWQTLRDSKVHTTDQNATSAQQYTNYNTHPTSQKYKQFKVPIDIQNSYTQNLYSSTNTGNQRDVLEKNQTKFSFSEKHPKYSMYEGRSPSFQVNPEGATSRRGMLEISQEAGPSDYKSSYFENNQSPQKPSQTPYTSVYRDDYKAHLTNQSSLKENATYPAPGNEANQSLSKTSVAFRNGIERNKNLNANNIKPSVATKTLAINKSNLDQLSYAYTPQHSVPPPGLHNIRKRPKWLVSEREGQEIKNRLSFNNTDADQDDYQCRCMERYWRCRRRPKFMANEEYEDYPPCFPVFIPCPCFL